MKFIDLDKQYQVIKKNLDESLAKLFVRQDFILGKDVDILEKRLAEYVGVKHCITCSNGTDALTMPLMLLNIGQGDAVFTTTFTFFSTAEVVAQRGATTVFVDCKKDSFNIDPEKLEKEIIRVIEEGKLTPKMIIPVDLFGLCADYDKIKAIAKKYNLFILEDGAQGFGATYKRQKACSFGDISTTSFFPAKPLGCYGDGGAIFTNNDEWASTIRSIRVHGKGKTKYENNMLGLNARLDTMQAAVLNCKLDIFEEEIVTRNKAADRYTELISDEYEKPTFSSDYTSVYAQYTILLPERMDRQQLIADLKKADIPTMIYYEKPLHLQKALQNLGYKEGDFKVAEEVSRRALSIPIHPYITDEEIQYVAKHLNNAL